MPARAFSTVRLVNGSAGDPVLYLDYPGRDNALLFDGGENCNLSKDELADLEAVFITHHHVDHFIGLDRIVRANLDTDKTLRVFGPAGTITRVFDRVKSYEYPFFPFMKLALEIHDLLPDGRTRVGLVECARRFAPPAVRELPWPGRVCLDTDELTVEAVLVDHTVPCLAFALAEKPGYHPDPAKLAGGLLRPGAWVQEVLRQLRAGVPAETLLELQGGRYSLGGLADQYFSLSAGARVAYVTDTFWSDAVRPELVKLARGAWRLYCDSFYAAAQTKDAAKHRHMLAPQAGELAKLAKVEQLVLMHFSGRYAGKYGQLVDEAAAVFPRVTAEF